jgi:hypothetical protein
MVGQKKKVVVGKSAMLDRTPIFVLVRAEVLKGTLGSKYVASDFGRRARGSGLDQNIVCFVTKYGDVPDDRPSCSRNLV